MGDLSEHFSRSELACPCCGMCMVKPKLVVALEQLREALGMPVHITSGYRCPNRNAAVHGARHSMHLGGLAADLIVPGLSPVDVAHVASSIEAFGRGGIGLYPPWTDRGVVRGRFVHLDVRDRFARWGRRGAEYITYPEAVAAFGWR